MLCFRATLSITLCWKLHISGNKLSRFIASVLHVLFCKVYKVYILCDCHKDWIGSVLFYTSKQSYITWLWDSFIPCFHTLHYHHHSKLTVAKHVQHFYHYLTMGQKLRTTLFNKTNTRTSNSNYTKNKMLMETYIKLTVAKHVHLIARKWFFCLS